ncbi:putative serine/threonine-protein kinase Nek6 [Apostichopus japonicus]|uniref:Putative serine/threonine-protein kinase Nek6 n=1 Tax=Stichopus japonicus TaxID=307972 RepID=A0A2G8JDD9_STIJA|nr:putative serine/threonine-protein kinase Nek6 [Apostichopus japonicus]
MPLYNIYQLNNVDKCPFLCIIPTIQITSDLNNHFRYSRGSSRPGSADDDLLRSNYLGAEGYEDDSFEEEDEDDLDEEKGCRQLIERHCKDILGEKVFSEIQSKLKTKNASGITSSDLCCHIFLPRLEFEHHIDSDLKETCFILSEILSKK